MIDITSSFISDCASLRQRRPIVLNLTNYVAMTPTANALLAVGASPVMTFNPAEMSEMVALSASVVVNIGCLDHQQQTAARIATSAAARQGRPWVLDPVGAGASRQRTDLCHRLLQRHHPTVVRCNASEMLALCSDNIPSGGVDSLATVEAVAELAQQFAAQHHVVASISGDVDLITDGLTTLRIANGSPRMTDITAMGCTATALTAALLAVQPNALLAAAEAMALMGVAGETATRTGLSTGTMATSFLDELSCFDPEDYARRIRCTIDTTRTYSSKDSI